MLAYTVARMIKDGDEIENKGRKQAFVSLPKSTLYHSFSHIITFY